MLTTPAGYQRDEHHAANHADVERRADTIPRNASRSKPCARCSPPVKSRSLSRRRTWGVPESVKVGGPNRVNPEISAQELGTRWSEAAD
jgi:hypothetical protein